MNIQCSRHIPLSTDLCNKWPYNKGYQCSQGWKDFGLNKPTIKQAVSKCVTLQITTVLKRHWQFHYLHCSQSRCHKSKTL